MTTDGQRLRETAEECVALVASEFGRTLDWQLSSLGELDVICQDELLRDGPLVGDRLDLWYFLIGVYTGEVMVRVYGAEWVTHERAPGYAVMLHGTTGFPFTIARRVLNAEEGKSLASFGRVLLVIVEHSRTAGESKPDA
jgi:hypothetical protein